MLQRLKEKSVCLGVIGQGYVGLPVSLAFASHCKVVGFDIDPQKIARLQQGQDPGKELSPGDFAGKDILFTTDTTDLQSCSFYIVAVPTPVDSFKQPDLKALLTACETLSPLLKQGDVVVFESTVYPGCTEEDCIPALEKQTALKAGKDFFVGYSPERINPGDKAHTLDKIIKVVSAQDPETLELVADVYGMVAKAGVYKASSIKVAEAAKIIENTQRDVNIALMNELAMIFQKLNLNTFEVLEAAGTKWNFLPFTPGLVGGHCIGVDPYYLTHKAQQLGHHTKVITAGRDINDEMGIWVASRLIKLLIKQGKDPGKSTAVIYGVTFKENVADTRNSRVKDLYRELTAYGVNVKIVDPVANAEDFQKEYGFDLSAGNENKTDLVILAVPHAVFIEKPAAFFEAQLLPGGIFADIKGIYRHHHAGAQYWSL